MTLVVAAVVTLGLLVVVPLGLRLLDGSEITEVRRWVFAGVVPGGVSLWLPRGSGATVLASIFLAWAAALALVGVVRLARRGVSPHEAAVATALISPVIAASALVAERAEYALFGYSQAVLALTVAHFTYAGFGAALITGLLAAARPGRQTSVAALTVPVGIGLVLAGFFTSEYVELAGAVVLTAGLWLVAGLTWRDLRGTAPSRTTRLLLAVSALTLVGAMPLALWWAGGEAFGFPHLTLAQMAATHGVANAVGFALCGVLALRRLQEAP